MRRLVLLALAVALFGAALPAHAQPATKKKVAMTAYESGMQYAAQGLWDQAIQKFQDAINDDKKFADAWMNQGVCYLKKGSAYATTAREKLEYAASLEKGRTNPLVYYNLTIAYTMAGTFDKAFQTLDRCLGLGFRDFDALRADPDLNELRRQPEFRKILERHRVFL
jgi:Tfp pilus assembly protein PilF